MRPIPTGLLIIVLLLSACSQPAALQPTPVPPTATPPPTPTATPDPISQFIASLDSARQDGSLPASYTGDPAGAPVLVSETNLAPLRDMGLIPLSPDGLELGRTAGEQLVLPHLETIPYPNPTTSVLAIYSFSNSDGEWNTYTNHDGPVLKIPASLPSSLADLVGVYHAPDIDPALVAAKLMPDGSIQIIPIVFTEDENVAFSAQSVIKDGQEVVYNQLTSAWEPLPATPIPTETPDALPQPEPVTQSLEQPTNPPVFEMNNSFHKDEALSSITPENIQKSRRAQLAAARIFASEILDQPVELNLDNLDSFLKEQKDKKPYFKIIQLWSDPKAGGGELLTVITYRKDANDHVLWFGNQDGTLAGRPDAGGQAVYEVMAPSGYRLKFNWGEDGNPYLFAVGGGNKFVPDDAVFWFDTTKVTDARDKENLASAWTHVELPEASVKNPKYDKELVLSKSYDGIYISEKIDMFSVISEIMFVGYSQTDGLYAFGAYKGQEFRVVLTALIISGSDLNNLEEYYSHNLTRAQLNRITQQIKDNIKLGDILSTQYINFGSPTSASKCGQYKPPYISASDFSKACEESLSRLGVIIGVSQKDLAYRFKQDPKDTASKTPITWLLLRRP